MEAIWEWGVALILTIQSASAGFAPIWRGLSILGDETFFLILLPLLFWCISPRLGIRVGLVLMLGTAINHAIKLAVAGPRPFWSSSQVRALTAESSFGLPSAHAQNTVGLWGVIAAAIGRWWAWVTVVILALLVGLSRMALGVHFPTDVLAGWILGALILGAFLAWSELVWRRVSGLGLAQKIGLTFLASLLLLTIQALARAMQPDWQISSEWAQNAAHALPNDPIAPRSLETAFTVSGTWFGFTAGALILWARGGFDSRGTLWQHGVRLLLGIIVVLAIWAGLRVVFPSDESLLAGLLRYLRYTILGFWVTLGAPLLFQKLRLA